MSKLADLLKKNKGAGNPEPQVGSHAGGSLLLGSSPSKTTPVAESGTDSSTSPASQPDAPLVTGLNALIAAKAIKAGARHSSMASKSGVQMQNAPKPTATQNLANIDITLTTDVSQWPDDMNGVDMSEPANQMKMLLKELSDVLVTDDVSSAMQRVMVFLHENPNLSDTLLPEDIQLLVKSLQSSNGVIIAKKTATRGKKSEKAEKIDDLAGDLADMGFDFK